MLSIGLCGFTIQAQADVIHSGDYIYELSGNPANATITGYTGPGGAIAIPSSLDGYPVVAIGDYAFFGVTNLTAVEIPDSVTSIGQYAFYGCTSLASLTISQQVASIGYVAFYHCSSLTTVAIPSNVTTIGIAAFAACDSLTAINVDAGNANYSSIDGVLYDKAVTTLIQCPAGKTGDFVIPDSVTTIGPTAFYYCVSITSVTIPDNVTSIAENAFYHCSLLSNVSIPRNVTFIGTAAFAACSSLTEINVDAGNANYSSIDGVLYNQAVTALIQCPAGKIGDFVVPESVTSIANSTFESCVHLVKVAVPENVSAIGDKAFDGCSALTNFTIPNDITAIGNLTFSGCTSLTNITIPSNVTYIGFRAFSYCSSLTSIRFLGLVAPTNVDHLWISGTNPGIRGHAFVRSNFPAPGGVWNGLIMGDVIPALPDPPANVSAASGNTQVLLTWDPPLTDGGSAIVSYNIYRGTVSGGEALLITLGDVLTYTDTGLTNGQPYFYKVSAVNSIGEGPQSSEVSATPATTPSAPQNLRAMSGNAYVNLTWEAPLSNGGSPLTGYQIFRGTTGGGETLLTTVGNILSFNDTGRTNGQTYYYKVSAVNSVGTGPRSNEASATPATMPGAPRNPQATSGDAFVNLTWEAPSTDGGNAIFNYQVWRGASSGAEAFYHNAGLNLWFNDTGLSNGQTYYYEIRAQNSLGLGPLSVEASGTPIQTITEPSSPVLTSAVPGDSEVVLTWTAPASNGGSAINNYSIYRGTTPGGEALLLAIGNVLTYTDTGLTNGQDYYYQISAVNSVGEGPLSNEIGAEPLSSATEPSPPVLVSAVSGNALVTLTWTAPASDGGAAITNYSIYRGAVAGGEVLLTTVGNVFNYTDSGLANGQTYFYKVSAINSVGEGPLSNEIGATPATTPSAPQNLQAFSDNALVNLTWEAPSSNGGSPIIAYNIYRSEVTSGETLLATVGNVLGYSDTGLSNGQTYYYKVAAVNAVGEGSRSAEASTIPATVPGAPQNLVATSGGNQVTLTWTAPASNGGSAITNYSIYRGTTPGGEALLVTLGNVLTFTDNGLTNGQKYYYQVSAVNSVGEGLLSGEANATPAVVPLAPQSLTATASNGEVVLTWSAPLSDGGAPITGYKVYRGTTAGGEVLLTTLGNVLTFTDTELTNGKIYFYEVSAMNLVGEGSLSNEASATPATVPSAPQDLVAVRGNGEVNLSWAAPVSNGGAAINNYSIYRGTASGGESLLTTIGNVLTFTDTGLTNGQTYYYRVSANNSAGEGAVSDQATATPATSPSAPRYLTVVSGNAEIALNWSAPTSNGGVVISGYKVYRGTVSGGEVPLTTLGSVLNFTDADLTNGQAYYYKVSAVNTVGEGPVSAEANATPATLPSAPLHLTAVADNAQVTLNWTASASNGGAAITGYKIYRGTTAGGEELLATVGNVLNYTDTGLTNGQTYYYKVSAVNSVGEGQHGNEISASPTAPNTNGNGDITLIIVIIVVIVLVIAVVVWLLARRRK